MISDTQKIVNISIKDNEIERQDGYFSVTPDGEESSFLSISRSSMDFRNIRDDRNLITIRFEKDYEYETYERAVFSFLDLFGNLGGVFGILLGILIGWIFSAAVDLQFTTPWFAMIWATSIAFIVAVVSGLYPATKAAKLDPIESLRYE